MGDALMLINFIKIESKLLNWRQIEFRRGRMFMRFKRRSVRMYRVPERGVEGCEAE
jgi:hypothetical protein